MLAKWILATALGAIAWGQLPPVNPTPAPSLSFAITNTTSPYLVTVYMHAPPADQGIPAVSFSLTVGNKAWQLAEPNSLLPTKTMAFSADDFHRSMICILSGLDQSPIPAGAIATFKLIAPAGAPLPAVLNVTLVMASTAAGTPVQSFAVQVTLKK